MLNSNTNMSSYKQIGTINVDDIAEQSRTLNDNREMPRKQGRMFQLNLGKDVSITIVV